MIENPPGGTDKLSLRNVILLLGGRWEVAEYEESI